ncbi:MAG TPA: hypothetical protein VI789_01160 [Dehalococcoidia bacterium]|nr:hypothetical protein [Dehalococcoidia bacterium]
MREPVPVVRDRLRARMLADGLGPEDIEGLVELCMLRVLASDAGIDFEKAVEAAQLYASRRNRANLDHLWGKDT